MDLYNLHTNQKKLYGFDIIPFKAPKFAYKLASTNPKLRPELEPVIMKDPECACLYALNVLERRWPEAEPYIMKDPYSAYVYSWLVLKRRWPEAEPYIMKDPTNAYVYAKHVLKRRWPEAEPVIMKDQFWWREYKMKFDL